MKDISLIVFPAADLTAAKQFFGQLIGAQPYVDSPQYVGYRAGDIEIGLDPNGGKHGAGALAYWTVDDIRASVNALVDAGGSVIQEVIDVGYGMLVASVAGPNGATVGLRQPPKT